MSNAAGKAGVQPVCPALTSCSLPVYPGAELLEQTMILYIIFFENCHTVLLLF